MTIEIGKKAPDFSVLNDKGETVSLKDYKGKKIILYFYPKDSTPGCTMEARDFQSELERLSEHGYVVLGVSRDTIKKHCNFKEKEGIEFPLLADTEEKLSKLYDVLREKKLYGKAYVGIERSTFVIDEKGIISHIYRNVKAKEHVRGLLDDLGI